VVRISASAARGSSPNGRDSTASLSVDAPAQDSLFIVKKSHNQRNKSLYTLGKDRLAEIDDLMFRLALTYAPEETDEQGNPCRPYWENPADEARFLRFMGLSYDCAKARAPYESPRITPAPDQAEVNEAADE